MGVLDRFSAIRAAGQAASRSVGVSTGALGRFSAIREKSNRRRRQPPTTEELQAKAQELELVNREYGAREIEQDKPGIFSKIIDVLSRPNYAIAGLFEELAGEEPSVTAGVKRMLTEIFSGVGDIQGEKRAFGEALEHLGVGTKTLADAFPALEGTWIGNFGSRGAAGLALDIATDPLTYMTFGASSGARIATSKGIRYLNKSGADEFGKIFRRNLDEIRPTIKGSDQIAETRRFDRALTAAEKEFEETFKVGDDIAKDMLTPGGAKLFGKQIPGSDQLGKPLSKALSMLPESVTKPAVEGAQDMTKAMKKALNGIFSPEGALAGLPQPIRERAVRFTNSFFRSSTAHRAHLLNRMKPLEKQYRQLAKKDPLIGERWYDVREGVRPITDITDPAELELFHSTMALYDQMGGTLLQHGVLNKDTVLPNYIYHQYKNVEDLAQYHPRPGVKVEPGTKANFEKERVFQSYREAQRESKRLHDIAVKNIGKREADRVYPVLEPEFDVFQNMQQYIGKHSEVLARKAWREEMVEQFGKKIDEFDFDALYEGPAGKPFSDDLLQRIDGITKRTGKEVAVVRVLKDDSVFPVKGSRTGVDVGRAIGRRGLSYNDIEFVHTHPPNSLPVPSLEDLTVASLGAPDGAQITGRIVSGGKVGTYSFTKSGNTFDLIEQFGKGHPYSSLDEAVENARALGIYISTGDLPTGGRLRRAIDESDVERTLQEVFGKDGARYVAVKSKFTDNELVYLPKAISEELENFNSSLFNTKDYKSFGKLLRGFDWLNNNFKWGVYTLWPASAARDGYSNLFLSGLRIGANAANPKRHVDAVKLMAGRAKDLADEFAGTGYTLGQLRDLSKTFGVWVPGQVFVEQTGKFKLGKFRKALTEKRAGIENEARVLLWLDEIRRGIDPRSAADTVGRFLFNYGEVSRVERDLFRRLIPFYTFTRKNVELQWKMLRANPGRQINQVKPFRQRDSESESMVKYEAEGLAIRLDRDGKTVHMLTGIDLPLRNIDTLWKGSVQSTGRTVLGMLTPVFKTIPEMLLDKDFFTNRLQERTTSGAVGRVVERMPGPVKDWMGYAKEHDEAGRPKYTFDGQRFTLVFRSWMFSRFVSTSDRQFREYLGNDDWASALLDFSTGIRNKEIDLDEQGRRKLQIRIRQLEEQARRRGLAKLAPITYRNKGEVDFD